MKKEVMMRTLSKHGVFSAAVLLALFHPLCAFAGWSFHGDDAVRTSHPAVSAPAQGQANIEDILSTSGEAPLATSSVPKLFYFDCGIADDCTNAGLWYVDPAASPPVRKQFDTGVFMFGDSEDHCITTGTVDSNTYQVSNLKTGYIVYFKGGKIWLVNTTSLAKTQLSSETGMLPGKVCFFKSFIHWRNPLSSTLMYELAGLDGQCQSGDEVKKVVKLNMLSTTAPKSMGYRMIHRLLLDGRFVVSSFASSPWRLQICDASLSTCTDITTFTTMGRVRYDATRILMLLDSRIKIYDLSSKTLTTLYSLTGGEAVEEYELDRDGFAYFATTTTSAPYVTGIKKAPVSGGTVTTLASFTTTYPLPYLNLDLLPSYLLYTYPNAALTAGCARSVSKAGGNPVVLTDLMANGGAVGDYLYSEDMSGNVRRTKLDGSDVSARGGSLIVGPSWGGAGDWHYGISDKTFRGVLVNASGVMKSYAYEDKINDPSAGIVIGTVPVNLKNAAFSDLSYSALAIAGKRDTDMSFGTDILLLDASVSSSLKRITNTNGTKRVLTSDN